MMNKYYFEGTHLRAKIKDLVSNTFILIRHAENMAKAYKLRRYSVNAVWTGVSMIMLLLLTNNIGL